ncbi:MAG: PAS domain S-box protein [Potamolinea sp.]
MLDHRHLAVASFVKNAMLINFFALSLLAFCVFLVYLFFVIRNSVVQLDEPAKISEVEELQRCKVELQAIADNVQDFIVRFDSQLRHLFVNLALVEATGIKVENYIGKTNEELGMPRELCEYWNYHLREVFETGKPKEIEFEFDTFKGLRSFQARIVPEREKSGEVKTLLAISRDITEYKKIEAELKESRKKYETLFQSLPIGLSLTDEVGNIVEANPASERILGISTTEHCQRKYDVKEWQLVRPDGTPIAPSEFASVRALTEKRIIENVEMGALKPGKEISFLSVTAAPIPLENYGVAIAFIDITERKQVEETLRKNEQRFHGLAANVPGRIYRYLRRADGSDALRREQIEDALRFSLNELELKFQERTAQLRKINESLQTEIRDRLKVEEALSISEERFRIALKNSPITVFHQDRDLRYTWLYNSVVGLDPDTVVGKTDFEILSSEEIQKLTVLKQQVLTTGVGKQVEIFFTFNGQVFYKDLTLEPLCDQAGEVVGITGVAIDITKERVREKQLKAIFEGVLDAIVISDDEGKYVEANPAACKLLGLSLSELLNKRITDFMEPGFNFEPAWSTFLEVGESTGEIHLLRPDGTVKEAEFAAKANFLPGRHLSVLRDITKRKQAQQALKASEERLRIALEAARMGTWDWNLLTNKVSWCANQEALFGMEIGSFDGNFQSFFASLHPEDHDRVLLGAKRTIEEGTDYDCEFRIFLPNGQIRWLGSKGQVFYDETGRAIRMSGVNMDISHRKQAEEELIRISKAVESASDAICIGDITGKSIYHNKAFLKLFEYTPDELNAIGGKSQLFVDPDVALEVNNATMNGNSWSGEVVLRSHRGSQLLVSVRADAIKDQGGKNLGFLAICTNITTTKQAEKTLRETQYLLEKIADTTPTLLYIYHLIANCNVYANRQCEQFFGCTQPEIQSMGGQFFTKFIHPEDLQNLDQHIARLIAAKKGEVVEKELRMKNANGEWRWLQFWEVIFTRSADGQPEQILGTAADITERKRLEEIRCDLEAEKELRKMQLKFFSMASHEFRTPLSTILLSAQSLAQSYYRWPEEKIIKNLQRIQGCTKQMTHLLEDILTINRADTKKLEFNPKDCNLETICKYLIQEAQLIYNHKNPITFVSQGQCQEVCLDEKIIKSILDNLLSNALKYSAPGKNVNVTVVCTQFETIFQFCDEGIGIPLEDLPRLFEPFQRGSNVGNISGKGLGLTVVKKCLDLQGGKISLKSEVDVGTQVTVTIPWMNCEV